jgi:alginate O-acetyltransferase complex protein AlgI
MTYALHPASLVAGPIDRIQPSVAAQREQRSSQEDFHQGLWRILVGVFVKFVVANPLYAFISVHDMARNPDRPTGVAWLWLLAYSFYLYADFASYTAIAIGFGRLAGLKLPENFDRPYLSPSLTLFWQRWHITLSMWLRDYIFFPLARSLRARTGNRYRSLVQLASHVATMASAGLWHGLTGGFLMWGVWHGLGLFVNGQLGGRMTTKPGQELTLRRRAQRIMGITLTYLFVTLGWVFFAADLPTALRIFARLFGIG